MKLEEIAKLAGVSRTTASYVINGKAKRYRVSDKTIERVMAIVKEHNFHPNAIAAGLRAGKTHSIGLIIPDLENTSYTRIANHLEKKARQEGYQLLISCSEDDPEIEKQCILHLKQRRVDAIIVSSSFIDDYSFYEGWNNKDIPIFALDRALDKQHFHSIIGSDEDDAKQLANVFSKHTNDKTNAVYIGALPNMFVSQMREKGFKAGFSNRNIEFVYAQNYSRSAADMIFTQWLAENPKPTAIFVTSFTLLQGAIDAILRKYKHLPQDLLITTFGDNELLDFLPCDVISLSQDHHKVADLTLALLLKCLKDNTYTPGLTEVKRKLSYRGRLNRLNLDDD